MEGRVGYVCMLGGDGARRHGRRLFVRYDMGRCTDTAPYFTGKQKRWHCFLYILQVLPNGT